MGLETGAPPVEFAPERLEKRRARQMHQPDRPLAATDGHHVALVQVAHQLAVGAQDRRRPRGDNLDANGRVQADDDRTVGERVRADRGQRKDLRCGADQRPASRQRVGRRAGGRTDHQPVAAEARERFVVHGHLQFDQSRRLAAGDDEIVKGDPAQRLAAARPGGLDERARFQAEGTAPDALELRGQLRRRDRREKTQAADVDAQDGRVQTGHLAGHPQHRAVPAKHQQQIHVARQRRRIAPHRQLESGGPRRGHVAKDLPPRLAQEPDGLAHGQTEIGFLGIAGDANAQQLFKRLFQAQSGILYFRPDPARAIP